MEIITVTNQKGGVGKTTTAHIMGTGLIHRGFRVLLVDADPQTNLSYAAGINPMEAESDIYDLFKAGGDLPAKEVLLETNAKFSILPGSLGLAGADMEFTQPGREYILREILEPLQGDFDYCIIDTPPTLGILTVNAMTASQKLIVPMGADVFSMQGLSQLQGLIENTKKYCNPDLIIDGLLLTRFNPRMVINKRLKESLASVAEQLGTRLYQACIRETVAIKENQFLQEDIFKQYPKHNVVQDYSEFLDEFLGEKKKGKKS